MASKIFKTQNTSPIQPPYKIVGTLSAEDKLLFHVGFNDTGDPVFSVSDAPENVNPQKAVRYGQLTAHNSDGWQFFDEMEDLLDSANAPTP